MITDIINRVLELEDCFFYEKYPDCSISFEDFVEWDIDTSELKDQTILEYHVDRENNKIYFLTDKYLYMYYHAQECCEHVEIEDINGDLDSLLLTPLCLAEESIDESDDLNESSTYCYYRFGTVKGYVDIRWYGTSNGWYSERVNLAKCDLKGLKKHGAI